MEFFYVPKKSAKGQKSILQLNNGDDYRNINVAIEIYFSMRATSMTYDGQY